MAKRIPWDITEAVILLNALLEVHSGKLLRNEAIQKVSNRLRKQASSKGLEVDEKFRNVNGITLQMSIMEYILTDGAKGLKKSTMPLLFREAVDLYHNDVVAYENILKEASDMPNTNLRQEQYFAWLSSQVSPVQLSELYTLYVDIEKFCFNRSIIRSKLFELQKLEDIYKVLNTVESNKVFRFTFKKSLGKMSLAMRYYYRFMKEHPELLLVESKKSEENNESAFASLKGENDTVEETKESETLKLDFLNIQSLAFTQPTSFSYFDEEKGDVSSWTQLYVKIVQCLLEDYPHILNTYINSNFSGQGRVDIGDDLSVGTMAAPKKVTENYYLETNISATDIANKIKRILDLCNTDYENIEVYYRKRRSSATNQVGTGTSTDTGNVSDIEKKRAAFSDWMQQSGCAQATIRSYVSAIGQASKAATEYGICDTDLILIDSVSELQQILDRLLETPAFREFNTQQHNRFRAAVTKLIAYRSGNNRSSDGIQPVETPNNNEQSPVISPKTSVKYAQILTENFAEDGYQIGRAIFRGRFKRFYANAFGEEPTESDENIDRIMETVGIERNGRIFPKQGDSQNELVETLVTSITEAFDMGISAVYIEALFDKYQQELANTLQIYNDDALAALLKTQAHGRFTQRYSYLTNGGIEGDSREDFLRIMKTFHQPMNYDAIYEKAWFIPYNKIKSFCVTTPSVVNVAAETYFYAPNLPVSADELAHLCVVIEHELDGRTHITDVRLMKLIEDKCPSIAINTNGYTTYGLRNCLGYLLKDHFSFNGPIITLCGKELSMADVYLEFAKDHDRLRVDELTELSNEMKTTIYWDSVLNEMIRVSETDLVRKELISFDVETIDTILDGMCPEEYIALSSVNLFLQFPNVGYAWNGYLLESYLYSCSKRFRLLHSSFIKTGVYGAMVRNEASVKDYRSLLVDVLSKSNALGSAKSALQYIVDKGYQQRRRYEGIEQLLQEAKMKAERRKNKEK